MNTLRRGFYNALWWFLTPFLVLSLARKGFKNSDYFKRINQRFGFYSASQAPVDCWIHAVSVGESGVAILYARKWLEMHSSGRLLISSTTPTGYATVAAALGAHERVVQAVLPYDYAFATRRFVKHFAPKKGIIVETEIWPNLFRAVKQSNCSLAVINVRLSDRSTQGYLKVKHFVAEAISTVDQFIVQTENDRANLIQLGADGQKIAVEGNIKFDLKLTQQQTDQALLIKNKIGLRPIWLAASTHEGEESQILDAHTKVLEHIPTAVLILVPRHPERFAKVIKLSESKFKTDTWNIWQSKTPLISSTQVLVGDVMGFVQSFIGAADVTFVGGSLVETGGHNILEASVASKPVLFGPHMFNFAAIKQLVLDAKAGQQVRDSSHLANELLDLLNSETKRAELGANGLQLMNAHQGALQRSYDLLHAG